MINIADYAADIRDMVIDETRRTNHKECGDTRGRLYFTSKPMQMLWYCHNCGDGGAVRLRAHYSLPLLPHTVDATKIPPFPTHTVGIGHEDFLSTDGWCSRELLEATRTEWDCSTWQWLTPVADTLVIGEPAVTNYRGYVARRYSGSPKYIHHIHESFRGYMYYAPSPSKLRRPNTYVLVEDQMSACAVALSGHIGVCMFGAKHSIEKAHAIYKDGTPKLDRNILVWYDNDNPDVKEAARITTEYLNLIGANVQLHRGTVEPKKLTKEQVLEVIGE